MGHTGIDDDARGISETSSVAILIGMTIIVTGVVGLNVLVAEQDAEPTGANFSYDYVEANSALLITHTEGKEYPAGDLLVEGPDSNATWAALSGANESQAIGPGDTVQLSHNNAFGAPVRSKDTIRIYHTGGGNRTQLSRWPEKEESDSSIGSES